LWEAGGIVEEEFGEGRGTEAKILAWLFFCGRVGKQGDRVRDGGSTELMRCKHIFLGLFGKEDGRGFETQKACRGKTSSSPIS